MARGLHEENNKRDKCVKSQESRDKNEARLLLAGGPDDEDEERDRGRSAYPFERPSRRSRTARALLMMIVDLLDMRKWISGLPVTF